MEYTTLENLKNYLKIEENKYDIELGKIIKRATKIIDSYIWQNLGEKTYWEYLWEVFEDYVLFPTNSPITSVNEVRVDDCITPVKRFISDIIYLQNPIIWEVFVEYKAWYKNLEDILDVESCCLSLCKELYENKAKKSEKIDDMQINYFWDNEKNTFFSDIKGILDKYKNLQPKII